MMYVITSMQREATSGRMKLVYLCSFACERMTDEHKVSAHWTLGVDGAITFTREARAELVADLVHDWCNVSVVDVVEVGA